MKPPDSCHFTCIVLNHITSAATQRSEFHYFGRTIHARSEVQQEISQRMCVVCCRSDKTATLVSTMCYFQCSSCAGKIDANSSEFCLHWWPLTIGSSYMKRSCRASIMVIRSHFSEKPTCLHVYRSNRTCIYIEPYRNSFTLSRGSANSTFCYIFFCIVAYA